MKLFQILLGVITTTLVIACNKEEIVCYDQRRAAVEFTTFSSIYSFKTSSRTLDTISIKFAVEGYPRDFERSAQFDVIADSTTATAAQYKIIDAIVKPGAWSGTLRIEVKNTVGDAFKDIRLYLQTGNNDQFTPGVLARQFYDLKITNSLSRPASYSRWLERFYLGTYSTAYYNFIIQTTGETQFAYPSAVEGYNNNEKWTYGFIQALLSKLKVELASLNAQRALGSKGHLTHDDGTAAGKEIIVGHYYN